MTRRLAEKTGGKTNRMQEQVFYTLASVKGLEIDFDSLREVVPQVYSLQFKYDDPRPSRNGLVSDSFIGWVSIGQRGGVKGSISKMDLGGYRYKITNYLTLRVAIACTTNFNHKHRFCY